MTPELARAALAFLERTTMAPKERQAFDAVWNYLVGIVQPPKDQNDNRPDAG